MAKGYHESGSTVRDLFRWKYADLYYLGFGVSSVYRYGPYEFDRWQEGLAWGVDFSITF